MTNRQNQSADAGSTAIQASGNVTISHGLSADDMRAVVNTLTDQLPRYASIAASIVEERLRSFREEIIGHFERDPSADKEAFKDPDFQYMLGQAQHSFARVGGDVKQSELIDLIVERSKSATGSRKAFTINKAIEIAQVLTRNEIDEICITFLLRRCVWNSLSNHNDLARHLNTIFRDLADNLSETDSSYEYIAAQGCGTISISSESLETAISRAYPGLFLGGTTPEALLRHNSHDLSYDPRMIVKSLHNPNLVQPNAVSKDAMLSHAERIGFDLNLAGALWDQGFATLLPDNEVHKIISSWCPKFDQVSDRWSNTALSRLQLTSVGLAIGHARASRIPGLRNAALDVWVS